MTVTVTATVTVTVTVTVLVVAVFIQQRRSEYRCQTRGGQIIDPAAQLQHQEPCLIPWNTAMNALVHCIQI